MSRLDVTAIAIRGNSTFATSQNAAPATTSRKATSQSAAPATKKQHACIDTLPKYCACHPKHENDLTFCDLGAPKQAFRARLPLLFILWKTGWCRSANVPPNGSELTSWRRVGDDEATTTRRRHDDDTRKTTRTQVQPQTPTINGNPSLRIREKAAWTCIWTAPSLQFVSYGCLLLRTRGARMLALIGFLVSFPGFESLRPKSKLKCFSRPLTSRMPSCATRGCRDVPTSTRKHTCMVLDVTWCPSMGSKPTCEPGSIKSRGKATKSRRTGSWALGAPGSVGEIWVGRIAWVESALKFDEWKFGSRMYQT